MKKVWLALLAILAFPLLFSFFFVYRILFNLVGLIVDILGLKFLMVLIDVITIPIDIPIGFFVCLLVSFSSSVEIYNSQFDLRETLKKTSRKTR
jgi:hypothetical protein